MNVADKVEIIAQFLRDIACKDGVVQTSETKVMLIGLCVVALLEIAESEDYLPAKNLAEYYITKKYPVSTDEMIKFLKSGLTGEFRIKVEAKKI